MLDTSVNWVMNTCIVHRLGIQSPKYVFAIALFPVTSASEKVGGLSPVLKVGDLSPYLSAPTPMGIYGRNQLKDDKVT